MTQHRRYHIKSGTTEMKVILDKDVEVGKSVTLKDDDIPDRRWDIIQRCAQPSAPEELNVHRKNKFGSIETRY